MDGNTLEVDLWLDGGMVSIRCPEVLTRDDQHDLRKLFRELMARVKTIKQPPGHPRNSKTFAKIKEHLLVHQLQATTDELAAAIGMKPHTLRTILFRYKDHLERIKEPGKKVAFRLKAEA